MIRKPNLTGGTLQVMCKVAVVGFIIGPVGLFFICNLCSSRNYLNPISQDDATDFSDSNNVTGYPYYIVPDIVHLIRFDLPELTFVDMVNIKSIHINHNPSKIIIHCNCHELTGKYWDMVKEIPELEVRFREKPTHIFDVKISWIQHAADFARVEILMKYGGIILDNDVFVVKPLHDFRRFEATVAWDLDDYFGCEIIIAHKSARILKYYHDSFRYYDSRNWYYDAEQLLKTSILYKSPQLVHRVIDDFGVKDDLFRMLYQQRTEEWKNFYTIHLMMRQHSLSPNHPPKIFDEINIKTYNRTYGDMVRSVLDHITLT